MTNKINMAALLLVATFLLGGCTPTGELMPAIPSENGGASQGASKVEQGKKTEITLAYSAEDFLNPYKCQTENNLFLMPLIYEGLFLITDKFEAKPLLCESYTFENGVWNFVLRQGISFTNGKELTAKDVEFSLKTAQNSPLYANKCGNIATVSATGKYNVKMTLKTPNSLLPLLLDVPIVSASSVDAEIPLGTGRYSVVAQDGITELLANENYRDGAASIAKINLSPIYDDSELAYVVGSSILDAVCFEKPFEASAPIRGTFDAATYPSTDLHYLGINKNNERLSSPALRKVISAAIDRKQITQKAFSGYADEAVLPISPAVSGVTTHMEPFEELLKVGNFKDLDDDGILDDSNGKPLKFTLIVSDGNLVKKQAATVAAQTLLASGISVAVEALPQEQFMQRVQSGKFELYYGETILNKQFDMSPLVSVGGAASFGGGSVPVETYMNVLNNVDPKNTEAARQQLYEIFEQDMPIVPLAFSRGCVVSAKNVMNPITGAAGNPYYNIENWSGTK